MSQRENTVNLVNQAQIYQIINPPNHNCRVLSPLVNIYRWIQKMFHRPMTRLRPHEGPEQSNIVRHVTAKAQERPKEA